MIKRNRKGFTLIELLLVLVILAVLAVVVVPKLTGRGKQAREAAAKTEIKGFSMAIDAFEVDCGRYPTNEEGLRALMSQPPDAPDWKGAYMSGSKTNDPWGRAYIYRQPGGHNPTGFDLYSTGPDGQEGTEDDITNWDER